MATHDTEALTGEYGTTKTTTTGGGRGNYGSIIKSWLPSNNNNGGNNGYSSTYQTVPTNDDDYIGNGEQPKQLKDIDASKHPHHLIVVKVLKVFALIFITWLAWDVYKSIFHNDNYDDDGFSYQYTNNMKYETYDNDGGFGGDTTTTTPIIPHDQHNDNGNSGKQNQRLPFSNVHPVQLGIPQFSRPDHTRPSIVLTHLTKISTTTDSDDDDNNDSAAHRPSHYPTNAWYQNMLLIADTIDSNDNNTTKAEPTEVHRVYTTPFLVDAVGPIPGLRIIPNQVSASTSVVQVNDIVENGLTIGAAPKFMPSSMPTTTKTKSTPPRSYSHEYSVDQMTPLGLTLGWKKSYPMQSSIVKGMPYGTMIYETMKYKVPQDDDDTASSSSSESWYPTVASQIPLAKAPIVDGKIKLACLGGVNFSSSTSSSTKKNSDAQPEEDEEGQYQVKVEREISLLFANDFTWLVFVSKPVTMQCVVNQDTHEMQLQVVEDEDDETKDDEDSPPFVIRIALAKFCTSNQNPIYCHHEQMIPYSLGLGQGQYDDLLRNHSHLTPGPNTNFDYNVDETKQQINIVFDWDARDMRNYNVPLSSSSSSSSSSTTTMDNDLLAFALPHHLDLMGTRFAPGYLKYCTSTLIGPACMLAASKWNMVENIPEINFRAPRPPAPWAIQALAKNAKKDIQYELPKFYKKGAGDTYFSGKMLAKAGRVLSIVEELKELCGQSPNGDGSIAKGYKEVCQGASLPTDKDVKNAVAMLRSSVEVWLNGKAVTPFVYDDAWGGVVSCGCNNPDGGECRNKFPECPAFTDPGLNFGNAFYNDLHFHYGYHIHAAAVVSHFDPAWGKKFFERVLLLVRNIANPSENELFFPTFRHKDWYQGHSWASGVVPPYLNGRNQESSSESIAAYEAVALYGAVMKSVFAENSEELQNFQVAKEVEQAGQILTATELRSTRRYYHVRDLDNKNPALQVYPREYNNHAIGMMWNTMAQYQTWFGGKPYLAVGIQLLPITAIAEQRDGVVWLGEMYPSFAETCGANKDCEENGWSILQLASLATIGYQEEAAKSAAALSSEVYASAGGNGHSATNTLWFIATRAAVDQPIKIGNVTKPEETTPGSATVHYLTNCNVPEICTNYILDTIADEYTCRQRMTNLMDQTGQTQEEACFTVAKIQFPHQCGACVPNATKAESKKYYKPQCPPCTVDQCESELNRCPKYTQTFVCTEGPNRAGCSKFPWDVRSSQCSACCELTECLK